MSFLAIDADILLHQATREAEVEVDWGDDQWSLQSDLKMAKSHYHSQLATIKNDLGVQEVIHCLSDRNGNFRKKIEPTYKANRKASRKPLGYQAMYDWLRETEKTMVLPLLEADDCLGILATNPDNKGKCIMVSNDKDLRTIPGELYRPMTAEHFEISEAEADAFFLTQTLCGDSVDGYLGCPKVGPVTAEKILGTRPCWELVEAAYLKAGLFRSDAIKTARLARILRWQDYDHEKGEVILWTP